MSRYILAPNQTLEDIKAELEQDWGRPFFICSRLRCSYATHYKFPGETEYRTNVSNLDLYLSLLDDHGLSVKRDNNKYYFDLFPADKVYLVTPYTKEETELWEKNKQGLWKYGPELFHSVGIQNNFNNYDYVAVNPDRVPTNLVNYVQKSKTRYSIHFLVSQEIENPVKLQDNWHLTSIPEKLISNSVEQISLLKPPGYYNNTDINYPPKLDAFNAMAIVICSPGLCVICRGKSGEYKHLATWQDLDKCYTISHICRACTTSTFQAWQKLLDE